MVSLIWDFSGSSRSSRPSSALGWMPICRLMMNSSRARPTPALGSWAKANACSGVPTFIMILVPISGIADELGLLDGEVELAVVDVAGVALGARDRDPAAVLQLAGGVAGADDGRDAELAGDDRGVAGAAAAVGDDRGGALHDRLPVGVGHVGDEHLALVEVVHLLDRGHHPHRAGADLLADGAALDDDLAPLVHPEPLADAGRATSPSRGAPAGRRAARRGRPCPTRCPSAGS